ncbi:hypothetical protein PMAYCL1PPCAC_24532 [Pristionchus mayeri]|uniref:Piwi domain-containing protein n=1 Tax=Pristionchus mayeri TaxID=1317129 RepID=A0AAN5D256_9BILA|nr:hypothetical protein PMAYCL1PPCAC_24532 [Pristionchus mayeri]
MGDRRKTGSSSRGNSGGGGPRRFHRGGGNNGYHDSAPSNDSYGSRRGEYGRQQNMPDKNAWDDHAREVDEAALIKKGLLQKREHRTSSAYEEELSDYPDEMHAYPEDRYDGHDRGYGHNEGYDGRRGTEEQPYYQEYDSMTPPRSVHSQSDDRRDDDYRSVRSTERVTWRNIEDEYADWSSAELSRELSRLQRRSDVVRDMLSRAEEREREMALEHYSTYVEEREFMQNVREGESFYERDVGLSPLGRQAVNVQQRRNDQGRGYIPAAGLDRYSNGNVREEYRGDGGRRREEERRDGGDQRGERRDGHHYGSNGNHSSTGYSETESRESFKGKKKRMRKHKGGSSMNVHSSGLESDESSSSRRRTSGYSTGASSSSLARSSIIHEHAFHNNHPEEYCNSVPSTPTESQINFDERRMQEPVQPSSSLAVPPARASSSLTSLSCPSTMAASDVLTPARITELAALAAAERDQLFAPPIVNDDMTGDRGGYRGRGGGYRGRGGGERGRGGFHGGPHPRGGGGGRGGYSGVGNVTSGLQSMNLGAEPEPLDFAPPKNGEQEGYKAAAKPAPAIREGKKKVHVISNVWQLEYEDRLVYRYDVSVGLEAIGNDGSSRIFSVNKGPKDDASVHERNELIREALKRGLEMYRILSQRGCIAVDGAAMMYANESLDAALKPHGYKIKVNVEDLPEEARKLIRNAGVKNVVIEVVASKSFNIKDLSGQTSIDRSDIDQSVKQFFEVITSEHAIASHNYSFFTGGNLYRDDPDRIKMGGGVNPKIARPIGSGQERREGMSKGFTLAEKDGRIIGALNIDVTTGTFWSEGKLLQTIVEINKWGKPANARWDARAIKRTNDLIKNMRVSYTPDDGGSSFDFIISGLTAKTWTTTNGDTKQEVRTMEQLTCKNAMGQEEPLFNKFSNANLILLHWPLIETKRARKRTDDPTKFDVQTEFFPIELLDVKAYQRVPLKKQGAEPERAMKVEDRWNCTSQALDALNLFGDTRQRRSRNTVMEAFGITLSRKPLETDGITRRMPEVVFDRNADVDDRTSFRTGQLAYQTPAHITTLIIAISDNQHTQFNHNGFARALLEAAKKKRMRIDNHMVEVVHPNKMHDRLQQIAAEKKKGDPKLKKVVFMYVEPEASKRHDELKLFERRFCVVTQHLTMENAAKMVTSRPTMENVLLKLNVKGGGHNYSVKPEKFADKLWMNGQTMIMGYDVWHPSGQTRVEKMSDRLADPSVVGFSFNGGVKLDSFIGDYHYQQATKEKVNDEVLNARIKWMLGVFEKNRGDLPPLIIVVRDGISDGQYKHGMDELEALREGAREYAASKARADKIKKPPVVDYSPKFIFIVATKRHHKRMYTEAPIGGHANMPAMSVVDDTITNPALFEFFLQSHTPLQGMAKATKYTVLKDDVGTTSDAIQSLMGALCFEHQISTNAISIPEPVYQSDEWAKRGAANMRKFKEVYGDQGQFKANFTYEDLTFRLSYWNSELEQVRVNA